VFIVAKEKKVSKGKKRFGNNVKAAKNFAHFMKGLLGFFGSASRFFGIVFSMFHH
jgi:hypothetical protein